MYINNITIKKISQCIADPDKIRFIAEIDRDVSELLPYLNAVMEDAIYDKNTPSLTITTGGQFITIHPTKIVAGKINDEENARQVITQLKKTINECHTHQDDITPDDSMKNHFGPLELFIFLHNNHCRKCGESNCMDFAIKVAKGIAPANLCQEISADEFAKKRDAFLRIFNPPEYNNSEDGY